MGRDRYLVLSWGEKREYDVNLEELLQNAEHVDAIPAFKESREWTAAGEDEPKGKGKGKGKKKGKWQPAKPPLWELESDDEQFEQLKQQLAGWMWEEVQECPGANNFNQPQPL